MRRSLLLKTTSLLAAALLAPAALLATDCTNTSTWGTATVDATGALVQISACSYFGEYSTVNGAVAGASYEFTVTGNGYITVHEGTPTGAIIAQGYSPLIATATADGSLFPHWNTNDQCGSASNCQTTTVQLMLNCIPPTATVTAVDDCANNQFTLNVNVSSLGDGTSVDLVYNVNGGADQTLPGLPTGIYPLGPFTVGQSVNLVVTHSSDPMCNRTFNGLVSANTCPTIVLCGGAPLDQTYCYVNNENNHWLYESNTGGTLIMIFSAGSIESSSWDHIRIYDGTDNTGTLIYQNGTGTTNLAAVQAIAYSGHMYMEATSDGSGSCQDGGFAQWVWQVGCLDCSGAAATYTVVPDCDNYQFSVDVNVTAMGNEPQFTIANNGGAAPVTATAPGTYTVGPFPANVPVVITLQNAGNPLCNVNSAPLVNATLCPTPVVCGGAPMDGTYCYVNSDNHAWSWFSTPNQSLILIFSAGSIESSTWDHLSIYDGTDNTGTLIYQNGTGTTNLAGVQAIATSGHMYMEVTSDPYGSCQSGGFAAWVWQIGCLDCTSPQATYTVVTDCVNMQYNVDVNISSLGSDPVIDITNNNGGLPVAATAPGTYTVGPFPAGSSTVITLVNDQNTLCNVSSQPLTNPLCPTIINCGGAALTDTYCYTNNDTHEWHWQSSGNQPLALQFTAGTIESSLYDHIRIYDGPDGNAPLVYQNTAPYPGTSLDTVPVIITGADLYMKVTSDGSQSCQSGSYTTWNWTIGCLDCTNPSATYTVVPDCIHHNYVVAVNISDLGTGAFARIANSLTHDTLTNIPAGVNLVGPFMMDSTVKITVLNATNNLCRVFSPMLTSASQACVDTVCAAAAYEYCYTNNDTAWFAYQGTPGIPLTVEFLWGQMLAGDFVQIYNGLAPLPSKLIWQGNLNGNMAGWAVNTTNGYSTMLVRVVSNASGSCATGQTTVPLHWVVQCGAVGVQENGVATSFSMYPNPTTGQLSLQLPEGFAGMADLRVSDVAGRTVYAEQFTSTGNVNTFDLKTLQTGNYVVTITTKDWVRSQQLQIVH